jgi:hypothetical protein
VRLRALSVRLRRFIIYGLLSWLAGANFGGLSDIFALIGFMDVRFCNLGFTGKAARFAGFGLNTTALRICYDLAVTPQIWRQA